jgi:hypothetical protein
MPAIPVREPEQIVAGDTLRFSRGDLAGDYPADQGWTLTYEARNAGGTVAFAAAASGSSFAVSVAASTTTAWLPGDYLLGGYVSKGAERYEVYRGFLRILPNLAAAGAADRRSHAQKVLDAIEAVIEKRATRDQESYEVEGRKLTRTPLADLIRLRQLYRAEVARERSAERLAAGLPGRNRLLVRFPGAR